LVKLPPLPSVLASGCRLGTGQGARPPRGWTVAQPGCFRQTTCQKTGRLNNNECCTSDHGTIKRGTNHHEASLQKGNSAQYKLATVTSITVANLGSARRQAADTTDCSQTITHYPSGPVTSERRSGSVEVVCYLVIPRGTWSTVDVLDIAQPPFDLGDGVGLPVRRYRGHLVAGQRLGDAIGTGRGV